MLLIIAWLLLAFNTAVIAKRKNLQNSALFWFIYGLVPLVSWIHVCVKSPRDELPRKYSLGERIVGPKSPSPFKPRPLEKKKRFHVDSLEAMKSHELDKINAYYRAQEAPSEHQPKRTNTISSPGWIPFQEHIIIADQSHKIEWSLWKGKHKSQGQIARQRRAWGCYVQKILDQERAIAQVAGSSGKFYKTSLSSCTCFDFSKNKKPCKHMYQLAMKYGLIDLPYED